MLEIHVNEEHHVAPGLVAHNLTRRHSGSIAAKISILIAAENEEGYDVLSKRILLGYVNYLANPLLDDFGHQWASPHPAHRGARPNQKHQKNCV
jgi:hypothetical protein